MSTTTEGHTTHWAKEEELRKWQRISVERLSGTEPRILTQIHDDAPQNKILSEFYSKSSSSKMCIKSFQSIKRIFGTSSRKIGNCQQCPAIPDLMAFFLVPHILTSSRWKANLSKKCPGHSRHAPCVWKWERMAWAKSDRLAQLCQGRPNRDRVNGDIA